MTVDLQEGNSLVEVFNTTGKKSPTSVGGAMNCPIVFREYDII